MEEVKNNYRALNKKAINCMRSASAVVLVITFIIALALIVMLTEVKWLVISLIALLIIEAIVVVFVPIIRYKRYKYRITDEEIDVIEGFLWITRKIVPIERLHKIEIAQGPIDRMYNLAKVEVTTAGGDITIRFLEKKIAEEIAATLKTRINEIVREDKNLENTDE
ncbi:MAG TPA: PH domain-containing protein [Anaerovoracaceae bacterium]|nr:PH domain-containing protein [Anaerovoracaceae bacterium]